MFGYICLSVGVLLELGERSGNFGGKLSICVFVCVYVCLPGYNYLSAEVLLELGERSGNVGG